MATEAPPPTAATGLRGQFADFPTPARLRGDPGLARALLGFALAAVAVPLAYALFTGHTWEDFFITFKQSRNLAEGHGLVYHPGERVHAFTSVINTLLPAFFHWVLQPDDHHPALWLYRLCSIAFYAAGVSVLFAFLWRERAEGGKGGPAAAVFFAAFALLEIKAVAYMTNGQEAGFMIGFLAPSLVFAFRGFDRRWLPAGLCWAGLMYTRPDSPFYITILALAGLLFSGVRWRHNLVGIAKAALVCTFLYLPWFIWVWGYYGSPVPHTITAKMISPYERLDGPWEVFLSAVQHIPQNLSYAIGPIYLWLGGWAPWVATFCAVAGALCVAYLMVPSGDRFGRMAAFCFTLLFAYFNFFHGVVGWIAPWYLPPLGFLAALVLSRLWFVIAGRVAARGGGVTGPGPGPGSGEGEGEGDGAGGAGAGAWTGVESRWPRAVALALTGALLAGEGYIFIHSTAQMRLQQDLIEDGTRKPVGLWLKENTAPGETVFLECLGYIGYYSGCKMLDHPGMASPEVVKIRKEHGVDFAGVIPIAEPDWLVLRPYELADALRLPEVARDYEVVETFDTQPMLMPYRDMPGIGYLLVDSRWVVLRRRTAAGPGPAGDGAPDGDGGPAGGGGGGEPAGAGGGR